MSYLVGCDISRWQGVIDWDALDPGTNFVIMKASGGDDGLYADSQFYRNQYEARRIDMPRGFYHFAGGGDPREEAEFFVNTIGPLQTGEVIVLDWEITKAGAADWCATWVRRVKELTGVTPIFYSNQNRIVTIDWSPVVNEGCGLWVAHYGISPDEDVTIKYWPFYLMHQYSSSGTFPGIRGNVDVNALFGTIDQFKAYGKQAQYVPPTPAPAPQPTPAPVEVPVPSQPPTPEPASQPDPTPAPSPAPAPTPAPPTNPDPKPQIPPIEPSPVKPSYQSLEGLVAIFTNIVAAGSLFFSNIVLPAGTPRSVVVVVTFVAAALTNINLAIQRTKLKQTAIKATSEQK